MRSAGFNFKRALPGIAALILALLLIFAFAASAFAKDGKSSDAPAGDTTTTGTTAPAGDTTTIGASAPTGESSSGESSSQSGELSDEERERRKEVYTVAAIVAAAAILIGIHDKRHRR